MKIEKFCEDHPRLVAIFLIGLLIFFCWTQVGCASVTPTTERTITGTITTTAHDQAETDNFDLTPAAAKLKIELAKIRAKVEIEKAKAQAKAEKAKAQAANPCSTWFMAPSYCYGAQVYSGGSSGTNVIYSTGGNRHVHTRACPKNCRQ